MLLQHIAISVSSLFRFSALSKSLLSRMLPLVKDSSTNSLLLFSALINRWCAAFNEEVSAGGDLKCSTDPFNFLGVRGLSALAIDDGIADLIAVLLLTVSLDCTGSALMPCIVAGFWTRSWSAEGLGLS